MKKNTTMIKIKLLGQITLMAALLVVPFHGFAATFLNQDTVTPAEIIRDDLYAAGEKILLHREVVEDVFVAGREIEISANVGGDIFAVGETVELTSQSGDDIFVAGAKISGNNISTDDLFLAGSEIRLAPETRVTGDAFIAGGDVTLGGTYAGTVRVASDTVRITEGTTITGDLLTYGSTRPIIEDAVSVTGTTRHLAPEMTHREVGAYEFVLAWIRSFLSWFLAGLLLVLLLPRLATMTTSQILQAPLASFGIGVLWAMALIPLVILLLVTVVGMPLIFVFLGVTLLLIPLSMAAATLLVGQWVGRYIMPSLGQTGVVWQYALLGAIVLKLVRILPVVGGLVTLILMLVACGALLRVLWQMLGSGSSPVASSSTTSPAPLEA